MSKQPRVHVNLFNNQWTTNFRLWNQGTWTSRVRLWAVDKDHAGTGLITPALEARYPLQAVASDGPVGRSTSTARRWARRWRFKVAASPPR